MRSVVGSLVILLGLTGCLGVGPGQERSAPPRVAGEAGAPGDVGWTAGPERESGENEGRAAGIAYVERTTGGAKPEETLPMIVAMHARGGSVHMYEEMFAGFPARARLIIPHGASNGRGYSWYLSRSKQDDPEVFAESVRPVAEQLAAAIAELRGRRPTVGRAVVCGFSQGGVLSFALAVLHPEQVGAAFPLSGHLPRGFSAHWNPLSPRPYVHAFHGNRDATVDRARASIGELQQLGFQAQLTEYAMGHELGRDEVQQALSEMAALVSRPGGPP